jgi:hypothetical protein
VGVSTGKKDVGASVGRAAARGGDVISKGVMNGDVTSLEGTIFENSVGHSVGIVSNHNHLAI